MLHTGLLVAGMDSRAASPCHDSGLEGGAAGRYALGMVKIFNLVVVCGLLVGAFSAWGRPRVVAYVPNWVGLTTFAGTIEYAKLTHINIAFENPVNDEGDLSLNKKDSFVIEKARAAGVKVLVSIGGGSAATDAKLKARYFKLIAAERRAGFVAKLVDY